MCARHDRDSERYLDTASDPVIGQIELKTGSFDSQARRSCWNFVAVIPNSTRW